MRIDPQHSVLAGLDPKGTPPDKLERDPGGKPAITTPNGDRAELALSNVIKEVRGSRESTPTEGAAALGADRIAEIQQRLASGHYRQDAILDQAAQGILELYSA